MRGNDSKYTGTYRVYRDVQGLGHVDIWDKRFARIYRTGRE